MATVYYLKMNQEKLYDTGQEVVVVWSSVVTATPRTMKENAILLIPKVK